MVWVSVVRSSRRLERHHGWRCRRQNFVTGVGNAPRPSIGLYRHALSAASGGATRPAGLQASAFDKRKCGTCTMEPQRQTRGET